MKAFFSRRKDGGKSHSDSSLYPPPSLTTKMPQRSESLDLASAASSSQSPSPSSPWDGKCGHCRKLMSRCLCHEDAANGRNQAPRYAAAERGTTVKRSESQANAKPANDKRMLLETLSGMHQSRTKSRVPLKMTQDRLRDRQLKDSRRMSNHSVLTAAPSPSPSFGPTRSLGPAKSIVTEDDPSSPDNRFTRSCPDGKWRSSHAITSTMRLAHANETSQPRTGPPKNLLAYNSKKPTNRYNQVNTTPAAAPPSASKTALIRSNSSTGNLYIVEPIKKRGPRGDENADFSRVWEL